MIYIPVKQYTYTPRKENRTSKEWVAINKWRTQRNLFNGFSIISADKGDRILACNVYKTGKSFKSIVWLPGFVVGYGSDTTYGGAVQLAFENAGATLKKDLPFNYLLVCAEEALAFAKAIFKKECHLVLFEA